MYLPMLQAYDFSSGKGVARDMEIWVIEGSTERKLDGNVLNTVADASKIYIEYRLNGAKKTYTRNLISVGFEKGTLDLTKYFIGDIEVKADAKKLTMTTEKNTTVCFANYVSADALALDYGFNSAQLNFEKINIYFTDAKNSDIQLKVSFRKTGKNISIVVNDKETVGVISEELFTSRLKLEYNQQTRELVPLENQSLYIYIIL